MRVETLKLEDSDCIFRRLCGCRCKCCCIAWVNVERLYYYNYNYSIVSRLVTVVRNMRVKNKIKIGVISSTTIIIEVYLSICRIHAAAQVLAEGSEKHHIYWLCSSDGSRPLKARHPVLNLGTFL